MADLGSSLQRTRIHRALSRPNLLMGADRELVLVTGLASIILIFVVLTWISALFGLAVWTVIVGLLRMMAKADPLMRRVYLRHITYRSQYRPTSSPRRRACGINQGRAFPLPPPRSFLLGSRALCRARRKWRYSPEGRLADGRLVFRRAGFGEFH